MEGGMIFATLKSAGLPYPGEDPSSPVHGRFDNKLSSFYCQTESRKGSLRMSVRLPSRRFPRILSSVLTKPGQITHSFSIVPGAAREAQAFLTILFVISGIVSRQVLIKARMGGYEGLMVKKSKALSD